MGKRELFIAAAFIALGIAAYEWTAPRTPAGRSGFSLSRLVDEVRRGHGRGGTGSATQTGTLPVSPALAELRVSRITRLVVVGERRDEVAYTLQVDASGPDDASALDAAKRTLLRPDDLGHVLSIDAPWPSPAAGGEAGPPARLLTRLTLHVPARLGLHVDGSRDLDVSGVAWVALGSLVGDVHVKHIAGAVTGGHRNGTLAIDGAAGDVTLSLVSSDTRLARIGGTIRLLARNGQVHVDAPAGPVVLDATNEDVTIAGARQDVRVDGSGGRLTIDAPGGETTIDVRNTTVDLTIDRPAAVTAFAADAPLRVGLVGAPGVTIDARATDGGTITVSGVDAPVDRDSGAATFTQAFGDATTARVTLRNRHAPIVIDQRK
jgi:hypothetical protein